MLLLLLIIISKSTKWSRMNEPFYFTDTGIFGINITKTFEEQSIGYSDDSFNSYFTYNSVRKWTYIYKMKKNRERVSQIKRKKRKRKTNFNDNCTRIFRMIWRKGATVECFDCCRQHSNITTSKVIFAYLASFFFSSFLNSLLLSVWNVETK